MKYLWVASLIAVFGAASALADGSVDFHPDVEKLVNQRPFFAHFISDTFEISSQGTATRIAQEAYPALGGARMGPYRFLAKRKGAQGEYDMELVINTRIVFVNGKGKTVEDIKRAKDFREEFRSIEVEPLSR